MTNNQMRIPFQRAMLFLTYLQGPLVNEWVKAMSEDGKRRILIAGVSCV